MPMVGESVTEGTVVRWLKAEGDRIARDEPLVEVETEKVDVEIPSPWAGVLQRIVAREGDTVPVGEPLAYIEVEVEAGVQQAAEIQVGASASGGLRPVQETVAQVGAAPAQPVPPASREGPAGRYSPAVVSLAREHGIDLSQVKGTGIEGRITRKDVLAFVAARGAPAAAPPSPAGAPRPEAPGAPMGAPRRGPVRARPGEVLRLTATRRTIAERMSRSARTVPHVWMAVEADVTPLARWRQQIKEDFQQREGADPTFLAFAVSAVVGALKEHPILNSAWSEEGIVLKSEINIGVAVATAEGLIVPVIHGADGLSIAALAKKLSDLGERARARKLTIEDVQGGTFTVDNTGAFGSIMSVPIINHPQAAIMTLEAVVPRPVVIDEAIAIRHMVNLCISFDHRILDGAQAGAFMASVKARMEAFGPDTELY
jgi:2-oxoisovalerate dehydrogenase E2 component (dihydrolipoyl transacylase)